jgi:hypothetical protein
MISAAKKGDAGPFRFSSKKTGKYDIITDFFLSGGADVQKLQYSGNTR